MSINLRLDMSAQRASLEVALTKICVYVCVMGMVQSNAIQVHSPPAAKIVYVEILALSLKVR